MRETALLAVFTQLILKEPFVENMRGGKAESRGKISLYSSV